MLKLLICFAILTTLSTIHGALVNKKSYFVQNAADNTYLRVSRPAEICKRAGDVITTSTLKKTDPLSQFQYSRLTQAYTHLIMDANKVSGLNNANEVTVDTSNTCFFAERQYTFNKVSGNTYYLSTTDRKKKNQCLKGNGRGKRISFVPCNPKNRNQHWKFIPV